jgi:hypothetical protein
MSDVIFDRLCEKIETICSGKIDIKTVPLILVYAMQIAEIARGLNGVEKKELVLYSIRRSIEKYVKTQDEKDELQCLVDDVLPSMIDAIVSATKGRVLINNRRKFSCCF